MCVFSHILQWLFQEFLFSPRGKLTNITPMEGGDRYFDVFLPFEFLKSISRLANGAFDPHQMSITDVFQDKSSPNAHLVMPKWLPCSVAFIISWFFVTFAQIAPSRKYVYSAIQDFKTAPQEPRWATKRPPSSPPTAPKRPSKHQVATKELPSDPRNHQEQMHQGQAECAQRLNKKINSGFVFQFRL